MNYRSLESKYIKTRQEQMAMYGRPFTEMDKKASDTIFNAALQAIENVRTGSRHTCMQAVSLATGLGKSTSAYALVATFAQQDPRFTAAYVVPTVKMAIEAQQGIEAILGPYSTTLWSSYHKHKGVDSKKAEEELGFLPDRLVNKLQLLTARIVIVTHGQLLHEMRTGQEQGTLKCEGKPRSIVFIDEHPDFVQILETTPMQMQAFHDRLVIENNKHPWLPVIAEVVSKMSAIQRTDGQRYETKELLAAEEGKVFEGDSGLSLWDLTDEEMADNVRHRQRKEMQDALAFLIAASKGNSFYSRLDYAFFSYQLHFNTEYAGFVLLDATSDITGLVSLHPKVKTVDVPDVSYERLELFHIDLPGKFKHIRDVIKVCATGREYGALIYQTILANSAEGDEVLVVVHKDVLTQELIESSEDPNTPLNWGGRRVNTQNWGAGVGLNKFKHKTHVFLFGEYHLPRNTTICQSHGWSKKPITNERLRLAEGVRKSEDMYQPQGDYLKPHEGHILRWMKQLAMRGTARQVDAEGKCLSMKLYTTMALTRLIPNLNRLFPNAQMPVSANNPNCNPEKKIGGRKALLRLLMNTKKPYLGANEIEVITGISSSKLSRDFIAIEEHASNYGWRLTSANDLNLQGRMKYIVNDVRYVEAMLKAT